MLSIVVQLFLKFSSVAILVLRISYIVYREKTLEHTAQYYSRTLRFRDTRYDSRPFYFYIAIYPE